MFNKHVTKELSAYCHGELPAEKARRVAGHLQDCERCRREFEEIRLGVHLAGHLTRRSAPESMWGEIESLLGQAPVKASGWTKSFGLIFAPGWPRLAAAGAMLLMALGITALWYYRRASNTAWEVASIQGAPKVGSGRIGETGRWAVGEWLETDGASRAKIQVGRIGQVEVEPNTRIRLVRTRPTEHRLALARGRMHAKISAPPRLFFVDTPSAVAIDLGCAYTLEVDDLGISLLHVTSGWVAFERDGRESVVPAGALCATRPDSGPGTPYFEDASEAFEAALGKFDFYRGGSEALDVVLKEARKRDTLTLWHLLARVPEAERGRVYERMAELVPPPKDVTRDGALRLDPDMLDLWKDYLELAWYPAPAPAGRQVRK